MRRVERILIAAAVLLGAGSAYADFVSTPVTTAREGLPYRYEVVATGFGRVRITAPNGLPPWLTLVDTGNGTALLSGTPSAEDSGAEIVLRSEDTSCTAFPVFCYRYQFFDITIIPNAPPEIVAGIDDQIATEGTPFRLDFDGAFRDPDGDALSYSVSGLPRGLSVSGSVIAGTPTSADANGSPYEVSISASDGRGGTIVETFALRIDALARADLAVESIAPPSPAIVEQPVEWSFEIVNHGPARSGDVELEIVFAGSAVELGSHACAAEGDGEQQRLVCRISPIEPGDDETVSVATTSPNAGDVHVTARIRGGADRPIDPTTTNDVATAALNVGAELRTDAAQQLEGRLLDIAAGDVDADGFGDLVAATPEDVPAALHLNIVDPTGLHSTLRENGSSRRGLSTLSLSLGDPVANIAAALADLDGDGDLDAVVVNAPGRPAVVFENDGSGAFTEIASLGDGRADARDVAVSDLDGDGLLDIVVANAGQSVVYFRRGDAFEAVPLPRPPRESVGVAVLDANGDALPDIVLANADGDASIHQGDGASFAPAVPLETGPTRAVASGDFNGDGAADLVFARTAPGPDGLPSNPVYLNDGAGRFDVAAELGASPTLDVLVADLDGDERLDIVFVNATGAHQRFLGDGNGAFTLDPALLVVPRGAKGATARIGLREATDLLIAGENGLSVFFNDGLGSLGLGDVEPPVIDLVGAPEIAVRIDERYEDPGAIATDDVDGELTAKVDNPVDTKVIGTYTVTYTAVDGAGNEAVPVTRTVRVETRAAQGGGGGGGIGAGWLALLAYAAIRRSPVANSGGSRKP